MDVTYAEVRKPRKGGGAERHDHAPSSTHQRPGPAPSTTGSTPPAAAAYEVVTPPTPTPPAGAGSSAPLGFNFRVGKPQGPREPPADWPRV